MDESLKQQLLAQKRLVGCFVSIRSPDIVEIIGHCGVDFVILDMEHGALSIGDVADMVQAARSARLKVLVRIQGANLFQIGHVLDAGADGVVVPRINSVAEAEEVARASRYAPRGTRGLAYSTRACRYGLRDVASYVREANEATVLVVQIETKQAMENLDRILEVEEIDALFIGPLDLSQALGMTGETTNPKLVAIIEEMVDKIRARGVAAGTLATSVAAVEKWSARGVQLLALTLGQMYGPFASLVKECKKATTT